MNYQRARAGERASERAVTRARERIDDSESRAMRVNVASKIFIERALVHRACCSLRHIYPA